MPPPKPIPKDIPEGPSKTQRKAAMLDLQDLGERLVALPITRLKRLDIDETLREAVLEAQRLTAHGARRRQMQYIGRLMRDADPAPIEVAIAAFEGKSRAETARFQRLEQLRDRVLADEKVITEIGNEHPGADLQRLNQLRRNALRERETGAAPKNYRAIFQMIKTLYEPDTAASSASDAVPEDEDAES